MASHFEIARNLPRFQEHRPMMLKDFLRNDSFQHSRVSSSSLSSPNGFPMYPKNSAVLLRSRSKKAAATTISAVVNVVKFLQFASAKAPLALPRSISRRLLQTKGRKGKKDIFKDDQASEVQDRVKVKDILRWKSFRDLVEDDCTPLDLPPSPNRSTTTTTTSCSKRSSWCESDFTAEEELPPSWGGENEELLSKKSNFLGHQSPLRNHKGDWSFEEYEQQSPVSVLDSPFREVLHQDSISPFHPKLGGTRCMLSRRFHELERKASPKHTTKTHSFRDEVSIFGEKAKQLLRRVGEFDCSHHDSDVILDFFVHELSLNGNTSDSEFESDMLKTARSWINDEHDESYEWEFGDKRGSYVRDMEKGVCWKEFKQEQEELSEELGIRVFEELIEELMDEIFD